MLVSYSNYCQSTWHIVYGADSRGDNLSLSVKRQQGKAGFAFTLCLLARFVR